MAILKQTKLPGILYHNITPLPTLTKAQFEVIIDRCVANHLAEELRLTCGNCGIFAIALKNMMGRGDLIGVGRCNGGSCSHVLYRETQDSLLADAEGYHTPKELKGYWGSYNGTFNNEPYICNNTCRDIDVPHMENILLMLANNEPMDAIFDYYHAHQVRTGGDYTEVS